jgi:hypothetical protein
LITNAIKEKGFREEDGVMNWPKIIRERDARIDAMADKIKSFYG